MLGRKDVPHSGSKSRRIDEFSACTCLLDLISKLLNQGRKEVKVAKVKWVVRARGHPNITATHRTTFMTTRDPEVGPRGDCIIGVKAEMGAAHLPQALKNLVRSGKEFIIRISAGGVEEKVMAKGHPALSLVHPRDLVVRKSRFLCGRTVAIEADKAAIDLSRKLIAKLKDPQTTVEVCFQARP